MRPEKTRVVNGKRRCIYAEGKNERLGKICYEGPLDAARALAYHHASPGSADVYLCHVCDYLHLTSRVSV